MEIYEWLSLVGLQSPRVVLGDAIDPYLSRYQVPNDNSENTMNLVTLTWTGFLPAQWVRGLFAELR